MPLLAIAGELVRRGHSCLLLGNEHFRGEAHARGVAFHALHLFPIRIRSLIAPPWPLGARACGPDGERFLKVVLPALYRAADLHPEVLAKINASRATLGLAPARSANHERSHVVAEAAMFPDWYGMPAKGHASPAAVACA
jgi:hypothetical protein